jgi:Na+/proline symporter
VIGGFFLALSYFGTDQSQVGRYLTAKTVSESRVGLLMNGLVKVPMQFLILLVGAMVFAFYQFNPAPLFFNQTQVTKVASSSYRDSLKNIEVEYATLAAKKNQLVKDFIAEHKSGNEDGASATALKEVNQATEKLRTDFKKILKTREVKGDDDDTNYIFLRFVIDHLPDGLVGLLIAVIFVAGWGSIAAALNSLASSTVVDIHKKFAKKELSPVQDYNISKWYTLWWGLFCIVVAQFAGNMGSLIEVVNVLGSLFYGVILGVFLVAFYLKKVHSNAVFYSAVFVEIFIIISFSWPWFERQIPALNSLPKGFNLFMDGFSSISFLWLNLIGAAGVVLLSIGIQAFAKSTANDVTPTK